MPETLEDKLVVGISSRALFDLDEANAVFERHGLTAFREYQREHEHETLEPGTAFRNGLEREYEIANEIRRHLPQSSS